MFATKKQLKYLRDTGHDVSDLTSFGTASKLIDAYRKRTHADQPTAKQLWMLARLGYNGPVAGIGRRQISQIIEKLLKQRADK